MVPLAATVAMVAARLVYVTGAVITEAPLRTTAGTVSVSLGSSCLILSFASAYVSDTPARASKVTGSAAAPALDDVTVTVA